MQRDNPTPAASTTTCSTLESANQRCSFCSSRTAETLEATETKLGVILGKKFRCESAYRFRWRTNEMGWAALHWRNLVVCAAPLDWILNRPTINSLNFFHEYVSRILSRQSAANSFGALGAFTGSYLLGFLHAATGDERASYILMSHRVAHQAAHDSGRCANTIRYCHFYESPNNSSPDIRTRTRHFTRYPDTCAWAAGRSANHA